jgi:hypothetical protein
MRRRAVTVVATQGISPVMAMLVALVIALILLLAAPVKAQETTTEETTVLAADAADRKVEAETDNVSAEVDNGKVSVSTDDGSSSDDGTGQQSSLTVQQNQTDEGSGSRASTGDVNIGATRTSNNFSIVIRRNGSEVDRTSTDRNVTNKSFIVEQRSDTYDLDITVRPQNRTTYTVTVDDCLGGGSGSTCNNPDQVDRITNPDKSLTFDTRGNRFRVTYTVNFKNSNNNNNNNNNNRNRRHRHHDRDRHRHHDRDRHNNRFFGRGAANQQYRSERIVEERVIRETIPNKGTLANTGGVPLTGAAFLALASVGLGVSILRFAVRRDQ